MSLKIKGFYNGLNFFSGDTELPPRIYINGEYMDRAGKYTISDGVTGISNAVYHEYPFNSITQVVIPDYGQFVRIPIFYYTVSKDSDEDGLLEIEIFKDRVNNARIPSAFINEEGQICKYIFISRYVLNDEYASYPAQEPYLRSLIPANFIENDMKPCKLISVDDLSVLNLLGSLAGVRQSVFFRGSISSDTTGVLQTYKYGTNIYADSIARFTTWIEDETKGVLSFGIENLWTYPHPTYIKGKAGTIIDNKNKYIGRDIYPADTSLKYSVTSKVYPVSYLFNLGVFGTYDNSILLPIYFYGGEGGYPAGMGSIFSEGSGVYRANTQNENGEKFSSTSFYYTLIGRTEEYKSGNFWSLKEVTIGSSVALRSKIFGGFTLKKPTVRVRRTIDNLQKFVVSNIDSNAKTYDFFGKTQGGAVKSLSSGNVVLDSDNTMKFPLETQFAEYYIRLNGISNLLIESVTSDSVIAGSAEIEKPSIDDSVKYDNSIIFYNTASGINKVNKDLGPMLFVVKGEFRESQSISYPVIVVELDAYYKFNYVYIPNFNRYYYVTEKILLEGNLWEIHLKVDVLMSFKNEILNLQCIIDRTSDSNFYSKWIPDPILPVTNDYIIDYVEYRNSPLETEYITSEEGDKCRYVIISIAE